jgi:hypothetical protein
MKPGYPRQSSLFYLGLTCFFIYIQIANEGASLTIQAILFSLAFEGLSNKKCLSWLCGVRNGWTCGMVVCLKRLRIVKNVFKVLKDTEILLNGELYNVVVRWNSCGGT